MSARRLSIVIKRTLPAGGGAVWAATLADALVLPEVVGAALVVALALTLADETVAGFVSFSARPPHAESESPRPAAQNPAK